MNDAASARDLWTNRDYFWVVECKNTHFHKHPNIFYTHRIPLGRTDSVLPRPPIQKPFYVRCNVCGEEFKYEAQEVLRCEMEMPDSFRPHPLFEGN